MGLSGPVVGRGGVVVPATVLIGAKDEVVGVLLALFLGGLGAHHFYLRRTGLGVLYLLFSWTTIPFAISWVECFLMPGRVKRYNAALLLAAGGYPASPAGYLAPAAPPYGSQRVCPGCGSPWDNSVRFCARCGTALS